MSGKGDRPRNVGSLFHRNFKKIKGFRKRKAGQIKNQPIKWRKVYK